MSDLAITVGDVALTAGWTAENPGLRDAIENALPLSGDAARWGDELYFSAPIDERPESTRTTVSEGTVAYWPAGTAICLFWGPTPASDGDEPVAAAPVGVVAEIDDVAPLATVDGGARVELAHG